MGSAQRCAQHSVQDEGASDRMSALGVLVGDCLGVGAYRRVYALHHLPGHVLKVEYANSCSFANAMEWETWNELRGTEWESWLAPCLSIDGHGRALVQSRCEPVPDPTWAALTEVPAFFSDVAQRNFGLLDGRVVCLDYSLNRLMQRGRSRVRMVPRPGASTDKRL